MIKPENVSSESQISDSSQSSSGSSSESHVGSRSKNKKSDKKKKEKIDINFSHRTEALAELYRGTAMLKFPRRGKSSAHFKFVQLTRSKTSLYLQWFSKKKPLKDTTINIIDMIKVLKGRESGAFKRFKQENLVNFSFSIIYYGDVSLDLVAKSPAECNMWVECIQELIQRANNREKLISIKEVWVNHKFVDRNRPKRELKDPNMIRPNTISYKHRSIDSKLHAKNNSDVEQLRKRYKKLTRLANNPDIRDLEEHVNLMQSLAALDDRLEELVVETRESKNSQMSKREIWRFNADLETLEEKTQVLQKNSEFLLI